MFIPWTDPIEAAVAAIFGLPQAEAIAALTEMFQEISRATGMDQGALADFIEDWIEQRGEEGEAPKPGGTHEA